MLASGHTKEQKNDLDGSQIKVLPRLLNIQPLCFAVLYGIWTLPGTIFLRHVCLGIGALVSLYFIYQARTLFFNKRAIPIWLLVGLFIWMSFLWVYS